MEGEGWHLLAKRATSAAEGLTGVVAIAGKSERVDAQQGKSAFMFRLANLNNSNSVRSSTD